MYTQKDIVMLHDGWTGNSFPHVILEQRPDGSYLTQCLSNTQKRVNIPERSIRAKIGVFECDNIRDIFGPMNRVAQSNPQSQQSHSALTMLQNMAGMGSNVTREQKAMAILRSKTNGDDLIVFKEGRPVTVKFERMLPKGRKYVFAAKNNQGQIHKYPLGMVFVSSS